MPPKKRSREGSVTPFQWEAMVQLVQLVLQFLTEIGQMLHLMMRAPMTPWMPPRGPGGGGPPPSGGPGGGPPPSSFSSFIDGLKRVD